MAWFMRRPWALLLGGVAVIGAAALVFWALGWDPNTIAASASAFAALAAFASAVESRNTARDATRALSYATKPILSVEFIADAEDRPQLVNISNVSTETIARATLAWTLRDGSTGTLELGPLAGKPAGGMFPGAAPAYGNIKLGEPQTSSGTDQLTITYWGIHGSIGWRKVVEVTHTHREPKEATLPGVTFPGDYSREQRDVSEVEVH